MSAEASIPSPPIPGKHPPLQPSSASLGPNLASPLDSTNPSNIPPPVQPSTKTQLSVLKSVPRPPPPRMQSTFNSTLPVQTTEEVPQTPLASRPNFAPFFTLINDSTTQGTHHPSRIHYIFSDDDESEVLTAACLRSMQQDNEDDDSPSASRDMGSPAQGVRESETSSSSSTNFKKGGESRKDKGKGIAPMKREERTIIVDINETGNGIVNTSSLSSNWQILNAEILNAPTMNNDNTGDADSEAEERALMLRIDGVGIDGFGFKGGLGDSGEKKGKGVGESSVLGEEEMQTLLEGFDQKMELLRKIVASGETWAKARKDKNVAGGDEDEGRGTEL